MSKESICVVQQLLLQEYIKDKLESLPKGAIQTRKIALDNLIASDKKLVEAVRG